jgi:ABC-type nitrate/sulfonate/bicarbonate transport system permease component
MPARPDKPLRTMRSQNGRSAIWGKHSLQSLQQMSHGIGHAMSLGMILGMILGSTRSVRGGEAMPVETIGALG